MATEAKEIELTALNPTLWANTMQVPLRKSLVAEAVADTQFEPLLKYGDAVTQPYMKDAIVQDYTPGATFTAQGASAREDTLNVDQFKVSPTYVDDINNLQAKYAYALDVVDDQAYQLKDEIDKSVFQQVEGAGSHVHAPTASDSQGIWTTATQFSAAEAASALAVHQHASTTAAINPVDLFAKVRTHLRQRNVTEAGDWVAVIDPSIAEMIEIVGTEKGFNVADSTLRNGYAGNFLGFKVYISNNLTAGAGNEGKLAYFGKSKRIGLVVQMPPKVYFKDDSYRLGTNVVTSIVYGTKVFTKNADRFVGVHLETA